MPVIKTEMGLSYTDVGILYSVSLLTTVIAQFSFGVLGKMYGSKMLLIAGMVVGFVGLFLIAISQGFVMLTLSVVVLRAGTGVYHPVGNALISREFKGPELKGAMGILYAGGDVGVLMSLTVTALTLGAFGWRAPPVFWLIFVAALAIALLALRQTDDIGPDRSRSLDVHRDFLQIIKDHPRILAFGFIAGGIFNLTFNYGALLLTSRCGIDTSAANVILAIWILSGVVVASLYGRLARTGKERWILLGMMLLMIVMSLGMAITRDVYLMTGALMVLGLGLFTLFPAVQANMAGMARGGSESQSFAMLFNFQIGAGAIFSFLAGYMSDHFGVEHIPLLVMGLVVSAIALVIALGTHTFGKRWTPAE
jgi:FSR family fosmidomycin resistance protein-like MFS transporter